METKNQPLLSFAIPTYNFGKFIAETVKSIEDGVVMLESSQFEIVILDGGSNDNTEDVVRSLVDLYKNIRYAKQAKRGGIDCDMNTVAEMTRGKYIWLFSADDLLERGWDRCIIPLLDRGGDLFLVSATLYDIHMAPLRKNPIFRECLGRESIDFNILPGDASLHNYLNQAVTLEALFSYMSAIVVNADIWRALPVRKDYFGSCWAHSARLMSLLFRKTKITYLNKFLIRKRMGNDSFMENGFITRIAISINGWDKIIRDFFVDVSHRRILYNILRKDFSISLFIYAKISALNTYEIERLNTIAHLLYLERNSSLAARINYFIYRFTPVSTVLDAMIKPLLPKLIRMRHKIKSVFV